MKLKNLLHCLSIIAATYLTGCASHSTSVLPQDSPSMLSVYEQQQADNDELNTRVVVDRRHPDSNFMHADASGVNTRFARLPNSELVMYITPHLTAKGHPVPGYTTVFQMYDKTHYALPGEPINRDRKRTSKSNTK